MRIGLDFDRVLFDTDAFNEYYKDKTGLYHVDKDIYDENGNYSPFKHAEACEVAIEDIWNALNDLERFLYSDIRQLEELDEHELVIVTRGNERFQKEKVKSSGAEEYFDDVIIVEKGSKDIANVDLLVDDREEEIDNSDTEGLKLTRPGEGIEKVVEKVRELEA